MTNLETSPAAPSGDKTPELPPKKKSAARFITPVLALVAAIGIGVLGGVFIGQSTASAVGPAGANGQGFPGGGTRPDGATGGMGNLTSGTVVSVDGDTIVLELEDGSQVTVTAGSDTAITTTDEADVSDLTEGDTLAVSGEADDDGNVTATSISEGARGFGGGGTPPSTGTED